MKIKRQHLDTTVQLMSITKIRPSQTILLLLLLYMSENIYYYTPSPSHEISWSHNFIRAPNQPCSCSQLLMAYVCRKKVRWVNMQCVQENRRKKAVNRQMARKPCAPPGDQIWIGNHCLYKKRVSLLYFRKMKWKNQESHYTTHNDTQFLCSKPHFEKNLFELY